MRARKWDIFSRFGHIFGCVLEQEWSGYVKGMDARFGMDGFDERGTFVQVKACRVCGKISISYYGHSTSWDIDADRAIISAKGQIPYEPGTHKRIEE